MNSTPRKTIAQEAVLDGVGLHSGERVHVRLKPAMPEDGIVFIRMDLEGAPAVASYQIFQEGPDLRTALRYGRAEVHTVEHLLSACAGLGITDLLVEVDRIEMPGLDGSALGFVSAIEEAQIVPLGAEIEPLVVTEKIVVEEGNAKIQAEPCTAGLQLEYTLHYPNEPLAQGTYALNLTPDSYKLEIAPARTFVPLKQAEALRAAGFGKGAGTHNTLVLDGNRAVDATLRFANEPVRHKILDLLGDLYVLGRPILGRITASRSGHKLNRTLVTLLEQGGTVNRQEQE